MKAICTNRWHNMLDRWVKELRRNEELRSNYMKELVLAMDLRDEGIEIGLEKGLEQGRKEGRKLERANTQKEKQRADAAEAKVAELEKELDALKGQILLLSKQQ